MSLYKALFTILISTLLISGSSAIGLLYYQQIREKQRHDPAYNIVAIVQSTTDAEALKTSYLAELLNLSVDYPTNLYDFSVTDARELLLKSPVIDDARVSKIFPGTIHVNYTLRHPIAFLADRTNTALDSKGVTFQFKPFFTPKNLPKIYLGVSLDELKASQQKNERLELALNLLDLAMTYYCDGGLVLSQIDVSDAWALSAGQRQIILIFEERIARVISGKPFMHSQIHVLRLPTINYHEQLANYLQLRSYLNLSNKTRFSESKALIIDLRLSELAFITPED